MRLIRPSHVIEKIGKREDILLSLERYGRTCYKSEERITEGSAQKFCKMLRGKNHLSVLEHESMTVRFICDRGVTHELVRHRLASYSQESTRYCNYDTSVTFIIPPWLPEIKEGLYDWVDSIPAPGSYWFDACLVVADTYQELLRAGWTPQQARSVLPNSLKTEIVMTANLREWMHVFDLRCSPAAHPQMRELMRPLQKTMIEFLPEIFDV